MFNDNYQGRECALHMYKRNFDKVSCLLVVWLYDTLDNNFEIADDFTKYLMKLDFVFVVF